MPRLLMREREYFSKTAVLVGTIIVLGASGASGRNTVNTEISNFITSHLNPKSKLTPPRHPAPIACWD